MKTARIEHTLNISEKELHSTLQDFLEEKEKEAAPTIWNFSTLTGLALVLTACAFTGHFIATEVIGLQPLPFMNAFIKFAPYLGGALLGVTILSMFKSKREKKREQKEEQRRVKQTYDKLDEFLYNDREKRKGKTASASAKSQKFGKTEATPINFTGFEGESSHSFYKAEGSRKLMKSRTDKKLAGVCGGLAKYLGINSTFIRIVFLASLFLSFTTFLLIYIALAIVMPKEPVDLMDDFFD